MTPSPSIRAPRVVHQPVNPLVVVSASYTVAGTAWMWTAWRIVFMSRTLGGRDPQQLHGVPAENGFFLGVAQERRVEDEVDTNRPVERIVGSVHDLVDAGFGDEMAQSLFAEDHRIHEELAPEVLVRLLLERLAVGAAAAPTQCVGPAEVRRQIPASVG